MQGDAAAFAHRRADSTAAAGRPDSLAARDFALVLRAGAKPTPLTVAEIHEIPPPTAWLAVAAVLGVALLLWIVLRGRWRRGR